MRYYKLIFIYCLTFSTHFSAKVVDESYVYKRKEVLCNTEFLYCKKVANGKKEILYLVNNSQVSRQEYKDAFIESKTKELELKFEKEEETEIQEEESKNKIQINVVKKLLKLKLKDIEDHCIKIKDLRDYLSNYLVFSNDSFKSQDELNNLEKFLLPEIKEYLKKPSSEINIFDLKNYLENIDDYPKRLNVFFKNSVNEAIKLCDDTKLLRKLLELINLSCDL